jgi:hypothetical protein
MDDAGEARRVKYGHLPAPVRLEETVTTQETASARDTDGGRDTDTEFMIRHSGS